jgi:hypothetical protein
MLKVKFGFVLMLAGTVFFMGGYTMANEILFQKRVFRVKLVLDGAWSQPVKDNQAPDFNSEVEDLQVKLSLNKK